MIEADGPFGTTRAFTKAMLDTYMLKSAGMAGGNPSMIIVQPYAKSVFTISLLASDEKWDWRRTKRELRRLGLKRKGVRREYHKRALDG